MYFEVAKISGRTFGETVKTGTARTRQHRKRVTVWFKGSEKSKGEFTITKDDAERLAHALLLACSTEDTVVQFPFGEAAKT
ncbi:MAG: hypothetical protein ABSE82_13640 [Nitrososphaerales archaeon]|jgi:hypothetical protein